MRRADADILSAVRDQFPAGPPPKLGVAVSGGGDSVALLHILIRCFATEGVDIHAATVDHGLRAESAREAARVAALCDGLGIPHSTLTWRGWDGAGNLQDQARRARYFLLGEWAGSREIRDVAVGHTADDQAETVLMRLGRASGVTGLAGMPVRRSQNGVTLVRPMLFLGRAQLRDYLRRHGLDWIEDPGNDDTRFERVRARRALTVLAPLGITVSALSKVAENMAQARDALNWFSFLSAREMVTVDGGDLVIDHARVRTLPAEVCRRLIVEAVIWITGDEYAPRRSAIAGALDAVRRKKSVTLNGCRMVHHGSDMWICREFNAVRDTRSAPGDAWDGRWRLTGPPQTGCEVRALGAHGLNRCAGWRQTGRPRAALIASPSLWRGDDLIAAPLAGFDAGWRAELQVSGETFFATLLSH